MSDYDAERESFIETVLAEDGPTCNRCGNPTDYRRGHDGLCRLCDHADWERRSAGYDARKAADMREHPAKGRRRPLERVPDLVAIVAAQERRRAYIDAHLDDGDDRDF